MKKRQTKQREDPLRNLAKVTVDKYADLMMPKKEGWDELEYMIYIALQYAREETIEECAKACDVDWPKGMPAQAIEYRAAEVLRERIRSLRHTTKEKSK